MERRLCFGWDWFLAARLVATYVRADVAKKPRRMKRAESTTPKQELQRVTLRFLDSSVPPRYHRSYTIVVEAGRVEITVDVYGDIITRDERELDVEQWGELTDEVPQLPGALTKDDELTTGATSYQLELTTKRGQRVLTWTEGTTPGSASATRFARAVEALVPDLAALKETE